MCKAQSSGVAGPSAGSHTSESCGGAAAVLQRHEKIYESQEQQKQWSEELRPFTRMMPEAWTFQRGQARLVVPIWGNMAPDPACMAIFCTPIEGRRGRGENLCLQFGG